MNTRLLFLVPLISCNFNSSPDQCIGICWEYTQQIEDSNPQDGKYDLQCFNTLHDLFNPNLPSMQELTGEVCVQQDITHQMENLIIAVHTAGSVSGVPQADQQAYASAVNNISTNLKVACRNHLLTQGCAVGFDGGTQQQQEAFDAWNAICDTFLVEPSQDAMFDFTGCNGWVPPEKATLAMVPMTNVAEDCLDTDGPELGAPSCVMEEGDGGADDTSGGGELLTNPFGDLANLISCMVSGSNITCTIDPELLENVTRNFTVFYDEQVLLSMVSLSGGTIVGAQLSGVSSGEDSYELLRTYFGMANNDVITHVNSVALDSTSNVEDVVNSLFGATSWSVTVRRWNGSTWTTRNYSVSLSM